MVAVVGYLAYQGAGVEPGRLRTTAVGGDSILKRKVILSGYAHGTGSGRTQQKAKEAAVAAAYNNANCEAATTAAKADDDLQCGLGYMPDGPLTCVKIDPTKVGTAGGCINVTATFSGGTKNQWQGSADCRLKCNCSQKCKPARFTPTSTPVPAYSSTPGF